MSEIKKLGHHYSMENPASVYDEEAMTALELAGRTTAKVNETVDVVNAFTQGITQRQDTFETGVDGRMEAVEDNVRRFGNKLTEFETETIPETVEAVTREKIESGALDHVVQESIDVLGTELDNLVNTSTNASQASAEIAGARVGNGRVTYPTLGDAIRGQTTNIKPIRLNPMGAEWKGDEPITPNVRLDTYHNLSGFTADENRSELYDIYEYSVEGGRDYLYTCAQEITRERIDQGWFIFEDDDCEICMGATNIYKFITLVDEENWVYRIRTPLGASTLYVNRDKETDPELWLVSTEQSLRWLRTDSNNFTNESVPPSAIYRKTQPWTRAVDYKRSMHMYASSDGQSITYNSASGMCLCTIDPVYPGQVFVFSLEKDVSSSMGNYFVFEGEDGTPAVQDIASQVTLLNSDDYRCEVTIPDGCVKFHTACDSANQMVIYERFDSVHLPWLRVTQDNLYGIDFGGKSNAHSRLCLDHIPNKIDFDGKKVLCIGDSITAGVYSTSDGATSANGDNNKSPIYRLTYATNAATFSNHSVSGSSYNAWAYGTSENNMVLPAILDSETPDIIIVALGVNDFRSEIPTVNTNFPLNVDLIAGYISDYLNANENTYAVFITPIPFDGDDTTNLGGKDIEYYRQWVYRYAVEMDMATGRALCVDGGEMPIRAEHLTDRYMYDGLHPSELGQQLYARWLQGKICKEV